MADAIDMATLHEWQTPHDEDASPRAAWLARRRHAWGASEVPALLLAYHYDEGTRIALEPVTTKELFKAAGGSGKGGLGPPRVVARKAGLLSSRERKGPHGGEREGELLATWSLMSGHPVRRVEGDPMLWDLSPTRDRQCAALAASVDAFATIGGKRVIVEAKCWARGVREPMWWWVVQVQAQLACTGYERAIIVCGQGWAIPGVTTEPIWWEVERDESAIAVIREVCTRAWAVVEALRARRKAA